MKAVQLQGGGACSGIAGLSQLPGPAGALSAGSTAHIKTSKHPLHVATAGPSTATRPAPAADTVRRSPSPALGSAATGETPTGTAGLTLTQLCCCHQGLGTACPSCSYRPQSGCRSTWETGPGVPPPPTHSPKALPTAHGCSFSSNTPFLIRNVTLSGSSPSTTLLPTASSF